MKVPAVAMAAAFACGIALGLWPPMAQASTSRLWLTAGFVLGGALLLAGMLLAITNSVPAAVATSVLCWVLLGIVGAWIGEQPLPSNHILNLMQAERIDLRSPLKWHGWLRDEPQKLPWGYGLEIELTGVDYANALVPVCGGLRLSFSPRPNDPPLPDLRAGDVIAVVTQARRPQAFRDEGAFDRRAYLAKQNIDLIGTLRAPELIARIAAGPRSLTTVVAQIRRSLRDELDALFASRPQVGAVLRAMLLGDRSFVEREEAANFQKTGVFHVLVIAGLHVGALGAFLFWVGRKLQWSPGWTVFFTLTLLLAYVAVVEQRPPVLRAALMAGIVVLGRLFYRRLDILNSAGLAALLLLVARPAALRDSSFQLTFVAIGCIAGLALPWLERTVRPYIRALREWRDVTRDAAHEPQAAQFRIDLRRVAQWISAHIPPRLAIPLADTLLGGIALSFRVWELLVLTIILQVGMLPLMAGNFHRIALSAPLVNLLAVPLTGIVVPLGFVTLAVASVFSAAGRILAIPLAWVTLLLVHVVAWFASFPKWSYRIPDPYAWLVAAFFVFAVLLGFALRMGITWRRGAAPGLCAALAVCSLLISVFPFAPEWSPGKLEVSVLDVGQGDSLFVVSPRGRTLLIDGGGAFGGFPGRGEHSSVDPGEEAVSPYLWSRGFQKIDVVALTHAHQDHLAGLLAIVQNFRVGELWIGREEASPTLKNLEELARSRGIPIVHQLRGKSISWDGVAGQFLWPEMSASETALPPRNDDSLVLRLHYRNQTVLLPGDAEKAAERKILMDDNQSTLQADVLKVGHHGSKNSTIPEFLSAVKPRIAIISAGEDNPYGHPSPELLARLDNAGVRVLRTDRDGAVHVLTDGNQVEVSCFVPCGNGAQELLRQGTRQMDDQQKREHQ